MTKYVDSLNIPSEKSGEKIESGILLGETRSLDPQTKRPCPVRIVERKGAVYFDKTLSSGKTHSTLIEPDADFYRRFANNNRVGKLRTLNHYFYTTSRCNLKCPVCYEGMRDVKEPSLDTICSQLPKKRGARVVLCGAEPTCRDDLPDLIRAVNKRHTAIMITNGLRIADMKYLRNLKEAGLTTVVLAMNGLNDDVFLHTNGQALLDIKLKALDNLEQIGGISVFLSATITKGVNEDQIGPLLDLEKQKKCIVQTRFRSMVEVGRHIDGGQLFMSELVKLICQQGGIDYNLWLNQQDFYEHLGRVLRIDHIRPRLCVMRADLDLNNIPFASDRNWQEWNRVLFKKSRMIAKMITTIGIKYAYQSLFNLLPRFKYYFAQHYNFRRIGIRVWPNLDTIDLGFDRNRCTSVYRRDGEVLPFCLANILRTK